MKVSLPLLATLFGLLLVIAAGADDFSFSADSMTGSMTKGRERVLLQGNAVVISDGMRITARRIELYGDEFRYAEATGQVRVVDDGRGLRLSTERLFYDRVDKVSRLSGPSTMEDRKNSVVIKGDFIENDDRREFALVQVNVRILRKDLSARSEFARYDRAANSLELTGSPTVRREGDEYRASLIRVDLDTDSIVLQGGVSGTVASTKVEKTTVVTTGTAKNEPATGASRGTKDE
jgi:lipopolysaccharide export system protein LptA